MSIQKPTLDYEPSPAAEPTRPRFGWRVYLVAGMLVCLIYCVVLYIFRVQF